MDAAGIANLVLNALLGTGGVAALLTALKAWRTRNNLPADETKAVAKVGSDLDALTRYWMSELEKVRDELARERKDNTRRAHRDAERIDQLEEWIWLRKAPPPPPPKIHRKEAE